LTCLQRKLIKFVQQWINKDGKIILNGGGVMHDTISPNVLKARFSRKVIQIKALATMIENMNNQKKDKQYKLVVLTGAGKITGSFCNTFASDDPLANNEEETFDVSKVNEFANKVLMDVEDEIININIIDNACFIKLKDVTLEAVGLNSITQFDQLLVYVDQIIAFTMIEKNI